MKETTMDIVLAEFEMQTFVGLQCAEFPLLGLLKKMTYSLSYLRCKNTELPWISNEVHGKMLMSSDMFLLQLFNEQMRSKQKRPSRLDRPGEVGPGNASWPKIRKPYLNGFATANHPDCPMEKQMPHSAELTIA